MTDAPLRDTPVAWVHMHLTWVAILAIDAWGLNQRMVVGSRLEER
jgi:hypothetical protein